MASIGGFAEVLDGFFGLMDPWVILAWMCALAAILEGKWGDEYQA